MLLRRHKNQYLLQVLLVMASGLMIIISGCSDDASQTAIDQKPIITIPLPEPPQSINTVPADSQVILTWTHVEYANSYNLYMATEPGVNQQTYATLPGGSYQENITSPHIIKDLQNGKTYYLVLTSANDAGESKPGQEISVSPISSIPPPATPVLKKARTGANKVTLSWDTVPDALKYHVYITYPDDVEQKLRGSTQQYSTKNNSYVIKDLENGKSYFFAVSAVNESGESSLSQVLSAKPARPIVRPSPPSGLTASTDDKGNITINWKVEDSIIQYNLFISTEPGLSSGNYKKLSGGKVLRDITPPYTLKNQYPNTYYFVLNAKNSDTTSRDSKVTSIKVVKQIEKPETPEAPVVQQPEPRTIVSKEDNTRLPYEKLAIDGEPLKDQRADYDAQAWHCVRHKKTGKVWEIKTLDNTFRDWQKSYPFQRSENSDCQNPVCDTQDYIEQINQMRLCSFNDWRLPTREELSSLLDKKQRYPNPKVNNDFFPNTGNHYYWTGTSYKYNNDLAWFVYFSSGYVYFDIKTNPMHIRLVRD
ncbi:MAG: DUF1566 domain-containing protein [Gammaproteobacteria bacterium]|nr:DUF1566 domain-containing protein [Gammaproteobacteria bacterium]